MSKKQKTYIAIVLDRSGSMWRTKEATVMGYNEQVEQIQEDSQEHEILTSLVTFNGSVFEHFWNESADKLIKSAPEDYSPAGSTALYDAMGYTIDKLQKTTTEDENTAYLVIVITDGDENASKQYTDVATIKEKIKLLQADHNWTFTFMGCNEANLFKLAKATGMHVENCAVWSNVDVLQTTNAFKETRGKMKKYMSSRGAGIMKSSGYHNAADSAMCANYCQPSVPDASPCVKPVDNSCNEQLDNAWVGLPAKDVFSNQVQSCDLPEPAAVCKQECKQECTDVFKTDGKRVDLSTYN